MLVGQVRLEGFHFLTSALGLLRALLVDVLGDASLPLNDLPNMKAIQAVYGLYAGEGKGSELASAAGTAWGLLNGVTEYIDQHRRARSADHRLDSAWFGPGAAIKEKAFHEALKLAA